MNSAINNKADNSDLTALQGVVDGKMDEMTVDSAPTSGSSNLVTSGGVYTAINNKADASALSTLQSTVNTINTYAIKSAGTSGQVWTSDGSGAGKWANAEVSASVDDSNNLTVTVNGVSVSVALPSGGKKLYTGTLASLVTHDPYSSKVTVSKEFDIEYFQYATSGKEYRSTRCTVSKGVFSSVSKAYLGRCFHIDSTSIKYCNIYCYGGNISVEIGSGTATQITTGSAPTSAGFYYRLYV